MNEYKCEIEYDAQTGPYISKQGFDNIVEHKIQGNMFYMKDSKGVEHYHPIFLIHSIRVHKEE